MTELENALASITIPTLTVEDEKRLRLIRRAAKKYQNILDTDIDEWIEAEAQIAKANGELNWIRVHQSQARNLFVALGYHRRTTEPLSMDLTSGLMGHR